MKTVKMRIVKTISGFTRPDGSNVIDTSYLWDVKDQSYLDGWYLPVHAKKIISDTIEPVDIMEVGDRVICEVHRGSVSDENGISTGGSWRTKIGIVKSVSSGKSPSIVVDFNDGDCQFMSPIRDKDGFPAKNIQIALEEIRPQIAEKENNLCLPAKL